MLNFQSIILRVRITSIPWNFCVVWDAFDLTVDILPQLLHSLLQLFLHLPSDPGHLLDQPEHFLLGDRHQAVLTLSVGIEKLEEGVGASDTDTDKSESVMLREMAIDDVCIVGSDGLNSTFTWIDTAFAVHPNIYFSRTMRIRHKNKENV